MGERFGFYTMMAILVLFLQAKFGLSSEDASGIYSKFYFSIYALALIGGIIADGTSKYKLVILCGILIMFTGYVFMAIPGMSLTFTVIALFTIALGNGLFKGNLQAVVGQMYDDPKYSKLRDSAFMIFYMGINIGAIFAPFAASGIRNWWLKSNGFLHDGGLPALCHQFNDGKLSDTATLQQLADKVSLSGPVTDLSAFSHNYLEVFSKGYNYAFAIAACAMIISLLVYVFFNKHLPNKEKVAKTDKSTQVQFKPLALIGALLAMAITAYATHFLVGYMDGLAYGLFAAFVVWIVVNAKKEEMARVIALIMVFFVVIFFWMSFHQNGLTLTWFARDYTLKEVGPFTNLFFTLWTLLAVAGSLFGLVLLLKSNSPKKTRIIGGILFAATIVFAYYKYVNFSEKSSISPEVFQAFNPLFVVSLTFPVMGLFAWMNKKNIEPSTPKKIGFGMIIASVGFMVMFAASYSLPSQMSLAKNPVADALRVTPYWLISTYLVLTVAELFLSPMGLSFVSKVAPSRFQGLMQGGWLLATAIGNKLLAVPGKLYDKVELWQLWLVFIVCTLASAAILFSILKRLEKVGNN